ncbi:MAG: alpha/beta hydrolase [Planctomycetes bacterium]|nr:alpha/beta hydrolase [Planctomycetota bacterium]
MVLSFDMSDVADDYNYRRHARMGADGLPVACPHPQFATDARRSQGVWDDLLLLKLARRQLTSLPSRTATEDDDRDEIAAPEGRYGWLEDEPPEWSFYVEQSLAPVGALHDAAGQVYSRLVLATYPAPWQISATASDGEGLRANAGAYRVDPAKIAVGGTSAGGQIASLVGVTNGMARFDPQVTSSKISSTVQLILNIDGLSDFTSPEARKHEDDPRKNPSSAGSWFGGRYAEKTELWHDASPIYYVSENTPPILFLNSARERFHVGRDEMIEKLQQHNIPYRVETLPNTPHTFWLFDPWLEPAAEIVVEFLREHL